MPTRAARFLFAALPGLALAPALALAAVFVLAPPAAHAQEAASDSSASNAPSQKNTSSQNAAALRFYGFSVGLGATSALERGSLSAKGTVASPRYAFSVRASRTTDGGGLFGPPPHVLTEIGLLAGRRLRPSDGWFFARVQAGASLVLDRRPRRVRDTCEGFCLFPDPDDYEYDVAAAPGLSAELELVFAFLPYVALGTRLVGNANVVRPFAGMFFTVQMGQLR